MTATNGGTRAELLDVFISTVGDLSDLAESDSPDARALKILGRVVGRLGKIVKSEHTSPKPQEKPIVAINGNGNGVHHEAQPSLPKSESKKDTSGLNASHKTKLVCNDCDPPRTIIGHGPMGQHRKIAHGGRKMASSKAKNRLAGRV